jgi:ferritin
MLSPKITDALNGQINAEIYSAYLYMSMATWFEEKQLPGFANWMRVQVKEEMTHALRFHNFVNDRGARVTLSAIDGPPTDWDSPLAVFEATLKHEQKVTGLINDLMALAVAEKDFASQGMLQWFVDEQVEEEANATDLVGKLTLMQDAPGGLFMLDKDLAARVFTPPVDMVV